jgi:hypothetical protein
MNRLLTSCLLLAGCSKDSEQCAVCVDEPNPYCVVEEDAKCIDDADCAAGFSCLPQTELDTRCPGPTDSDRNMCRWIPQRTDRLALTRGFATRFMPAELVPADPLAMSFEVPASALHVACAVFRCNPVMRLDASRSPEDRELPYIANAAACVARLVTDDSARNSLSLAGPSASIPSECDGDPDAALEPGIGIVAAGCWAYDTFQIVGATDLVEIPIEQVSSLALGFPADAACEDELDPCYDATRRYFGVCMNGLCAARCTSAQDCELAALPGSPQPETCAWDCVSVEDLHGRVCVPL